MSIKRFRRIFKEVGVCLAREKAYLSTLRLLFLTTTAPNTDAAIKNVRTTANDGNSGACFTDAFSLFNMSVEKSAF
jgi:hypothetical protein